MTKKPLILHSLFLILLILLIIFGGDLALTYAPVVLAWLLLGGLGLLYTLTKWPLPRFWLTGLALAGAYALSLWANPDIFEIGLMRSLLAGSALLVGAIVGHRLSQCQFKKVMSYLIWAGLILLPALYFFEWQNRNILGAWAALLGVYCLAHKHYRPFPSLFYLFFIIYITSRGAVLGLMAGIMFVFPYSLTLSPLILAFIPLILWYRPQTIQIRLDIWQAAWSAFWQNPLFGLGPGAGAAKLIYPESTHKYQIHAHNMILNVANEAGIFGLLALAVFFISLYVYRSQFSLWQGAMIAVILAHSLVDCPLFSPGLACFFAIIVNVKPNA